jgi:sec-independent protein translocase protein TatB
MFDFAWSEIALIAVVAMIAIGPKDMPAAIRAVTGWIKKARRMAAEFQTHVDDMVREADLSEVRASINEIRNFDIRGEIERTIDADGSIRATFASNPLEPERPTVTSVEEVAVMDRPAESQAAEVVIEETRPPELPSAAVPQAPAFVPPNLVQPVAAAVGEPEPPAFIPPDIVQQRRFASVGVTRDHG